MTALASTAASTVEKSGGALKSAAGPSLPASTTIGPAAKFLSSASPPMKRSASTSMVPPPMPGTLALNEYCQKVAAVQGAGTLAQVLEMLAIHNG